jgi:uncharacterized membrane protein
MRLLVQTAIVLHVFASIALVGSLIFNTLVLMPALKRIPPAHSTVISEKIGSALMWMGLGSLILLGLTGFTLLWAYGMLPGLLSLAYWTTPYGWRMGLMIIGWLALLCTGILSAVWYQTVLTKKLPYAAGLRELEERRAAQERVSAWQDRLATINLSLGVLAVLGGALLRAMR